LDSAFRKSWVQTRRVPGAVTFRADSRWDIHDLKQRSDHTTIGAARLRCRANSGICSGNFQGPSIGRVNSAGVPGDDSFHSTSLCLSGKRVLEMAVLQTARLTLGPCSPSDRADFIALELDPEVMRYLNGGHAVDHAQVDSDAAFLMPRGTEPHVWTARRTTDGAFVGWFCLWPDSETVAELGYRLRRVHWGQGLASEGASALVDWGFRSNGYEKVVSCTMAVNHASRRVMEKIGMSYARTVYVEGDPFPGTEHGDVWYALTRSEWSGGPGWAE
jgi:RimJ/RimL family protein N-acetyltransferase